MVYLQPMSGITHHIFSKGAWHDIVKPTLSDLQVLVRHYGFDKDITKALLLPTVRPRVEQFGDALFVAIHFPAYKPELKRVEPSEIDFAITKKMLVTVHYEPLAFLNEFTASFADAGAGVSGISPLQILVRILEKLTKFEFRQLDHIEQDIRTLETTNFQEDAAVVISRISAVRRNIIHFRRILKPQEFAFKALPDQAVVVLGPKAALILKATYPDYRRLWQQLETHHETLSALQETHYAFLSMRTNQSIRLLTLILIPLTVLLVVFGIFDMYPALPLITRWATIIEIALGALIAFVIMRQRHSI